MLVFTCFNIATAVNSIHGEYSMYVQWITLEGMHVPAPAILDTVLGDLAVMLHRSAPSHFATLGDGEAEN